MTTLYLGWVAVVSLAAFGVMGYDKRQARLRDWRVPEQTLLIFALLGGWPGAAIGMKTFHHKTRKPRFQAAFWFFVAIHLVLAVGLFWLKTKLTSPPS